MVVTSLFFLPPWCCWVWACMSDVPTAAMGVRPSWTVSPRRFFSLPRLSARSWTYHRANDRSRSLYGMSTASWMPARRYNSWQMAA